MTSSSTVNQYKDATQTNLRDSGASPQQDHLQKSNQPCLKLKGSLVPMTVLELSHYNFEQIEKDLKSKTTQAPGFFENLPVIIDLDKLDEYEKIPFDRLIAQCLEFSIIVVAVRGGQTHHQSAAKDSGLGVLAKHKDKTTKPADNGSTQEPVGTRAETIEIEKVVVKNQRQQSKIVHTPIRSGQQVYAADGDLIVMASVSAGAEILADGNIHVYGSLRGRALAGVKGDTSARIFCNNLQAELVSVAGQYKISEDIDTSVLGQSTQIFLSDDSLTFKRLDI